MDVYEYVGRNARGESMRGTMEAMSPAAVAAWLTGSDIAPVSIKAQNQGRRSLQMPPWLAKWTGEDKVSKMDLMLFTRQMANMVKAGLQIIEAIEGIQKSTASKQLARVLNAVREDLDRGATLSVSFARHPTVFDEYYVNMVKVGEGTGKLQDSFLNLYRQIEFDRQMRNRVKSAMRYPLFVVVALTIAMAVMTVFVIPSFAKTYANLKVELPLLTRILLATSNIAVQYWWVVLFGLGLIWYTGLLLLRTSDVRYAWDRWKLRLPVLGPVINKATIARFAWSFATALKANVPIVTAFQLVSRVVDNTFFEARIVQMQKGVERGEILSRVMRTSGIFSPLELQLISVAERTGEVAPAVDEIAQLYSQEVEYSVDSLSQTIEPLLLAGMGILVGILILGVFLPLWDLGSVTFGAK